MHPLAPESINHGPIKHGPTTLLHRRLRALASAQVPCLFCGVAGSADPVCASCLAALPGRFSRRCPQCAMPQAPLLNTTAPAGLDVGRDHTTHVCAACRMDPTPLRCQAVADYALPLERILLQLKFGAAAHHAHGLGWLLARHWPADLAPGTVLVPIPPAPTRWARRGYNQALLIARAAVQALPAPWPIAPRWLARHDTRAIQSRLNRADRATNLQGHFHVPASGVGHTDILLIDDVMTTGSTLREAARTLLEAGAHSVRAIVVARTA